MSSVETATVLITDLVGSNELASRVGPAESRAAAIVETGARATA